MAEAHVVEALLERLKSPCSALKSRSLSVMGVGIHGNDQRVAVVPLRREQAELEPVLVAVDCVPDAAGDIDAELI
jgi:hypothetical protein